LLLHHSKTGDIGAPRAGRQALPHLKGRNSKLERRWRERFDEPCSAVGARRPASYARTFGFKAIIAILIAQIINRIAPIAIAIFIVSSSSLVIALPLFLGPKDAIARDERILGNWRSQARPA
jgi:hypothetical protein